MDDSRSLTFGFTIFPFIILDPRSIDWDLVEGIALLSSFPMDQNWPSPLWLVPTGHPVFLYRPMAPPVNWKQISCNVVPIWSLAPTAAEIFVILIVTARLLLIPYR